MIAERTAAPVIRTTFERFEVKYWVQPAVADRVVRFARPYLAHDPFSQHGRTTRNVSLYLDTTQFLFHTTHKSGAPSRLKLRVRTYDDAPESPAFFEIKRKVKHVTLKTRATLPVASVAAVLSGQVDVMTCEPAERKHLETFLFLSAIHRVEPKVLVASRREAFVSRIRGDDVRMTIDREIVYQPARGPSLVAAPNRWTALGGGRPGSGSARSLVELKFRGPAPSWMAEMVGRFDMRQEGFSKYVAAIDHLHAMGAEDG